MGDASAAIKARGLRVAFGDVLALDGLDVTAPEGAVTALLGPNGAGKTTFVRAVSTLQRYDAGSLEVVGIDAGSAPEKVRSRIGMAGQQAAMVDRLTGRENLYLVARLFGQRRREAAASVARVIDALSLGEFSDRRAGACSGGQRSRLDLGASLVGKPTLLVLDEPATGLDPRSRDELWRLVEDLAGAGTSVLLTTQYLEEAARLADHVVILKRGRAVAAGSPIELRRTTGTTTLIVATNRAIAASEAGAVAAALGTEVDRRGSQLSSVGSFTFDDAIQAIRSVGITAAVTELAFRPPTLDEVFLSLTRQEPSAHESNESR